MLTIIISIAAIIGVIASVLFKPEIRIGKVSLAPYWLVAVIGAVALIACREIDLSELGAELTRDTAVNPLKILALFFGMTAISVFLDEAGFFAYLASLALAKAGNSQKKLFNILYFTVAVLTVFTSNDIVILTFTPFIIYFCRNGGIDCKPYLIGEFAAANTFSMLLIIGNPTNIYLAAGVDFLRYSAIMALPALLSGFACYLLIKRLFRKSLTVPIAGGGTVVEIKDKPLAVVALFFLAVCTVMLAVSGYIGLEMWYIALGGGVAVTLFALIYGAVRGRIVFAQRGLMRIPWQLAPFLLSMFTIVLALSGEGVTQLIASFLNCGDLSVITYLVASTVGANLLNNIPMSVLFGSVLGYAGEAALYATVIGSNIGALLTSVGALAGIMWTKLLKTESISYGAGEFVKNGALLVLAALPASAVGLLLSMLIV